MRHRRQRLFHQAPQRALHQVRQVAKVHRRSLLDSDVTRVIPPT
ncbi:hypothetical protein OCO_30740 [Mycobacterium intracellulare MOTT-02]|uniref:Uncharacterized protein n=2 Tax=Mycobacterium intracellulare TaxID=1767 RepID=X8CFY5_MYCIT|nr:hypothetical protein OCU_30650 [Mycobacterium intracellulare ATCC 13950]AFC49437.1 hypothetical protein OCO_30740 [Mycobacterium intracellulare MOTT-02]ARR78659.1 hypothetical protein MOTT12_02995 [Mycobacterium intracellulare subsp. yongonense]ETZ35158.1 hypothetical protein L843_3353 [Mycobacterium intracellulare MIN_061107_1834]EUA32333.1 hypothetical protein I548_1107 [Mycobacterium intracellulare]EUA55024.1 hypothetical protein I550_3175 [Mycobacterium intracellulare 1956]